MHKNVPEDFFSKTVRIAYIGFVRVRLDYFLLSHPLVYHSRYIVNHFLIVNLRADLGFHGVSYLTKSLHTLS